MAHILEYLIIIIQIVGFGIVLIKIGIFIGTVQSHLEEHETRIISNENQIKNLSFKFNKHIKEG